MKKTFFLCFVDLIEGKATGIFDTLDEESKLPKPTPDHFTAEVHKKNKNHFRLAVRLVTVTIVVTMHFVILA